MNPIWILCNPRTGSSVLCEYLNHTDIFAPYQHPILNTAVGNVGPTQRNQAFGEWLRVLDRSGFDNNPTPYLKDIHHQHVEMFGTDDNRIEIERLLPGITYVLLKRKSIKLHTASLYFARYTDSYHVWGSWETLRKYLREEILIDEGLLHDIYLEVTHFWNNWDNFLRGAHHITVYYEDMVADPHGFLTKLFESLNVDVSPQTIAGAVSKNRLLPMTRPEVNAIINTLESKILPKCVPM